MSESIESAIISSIRSDNLKAFVIDTGELAFDQLLNNGFLKDIPIFGSIAKIYGAITDIRASLFAKKVYSFLYEMKAIPSEERKEFIERLVKHKQGYTRLGEIIIGILERQSDSEKAAYVGKLFSVCAKGMISIKRLFRLVNLIDGMYIDDVKALSRLDNRFTADEERAFLSAGLMIESIEIKKKEKLMYGSFNKKDDGQVIDNKRVLKENALILGEVLFNAKRGISVFSNNRFQKEIDEENL